LRTIISFIIGKIVTGVCNMKLSKYRLRTIINEEAKKMGIKLLSEKTAFVSPADGSPQFVYDPSISRFRGLVQLEAEFDVPELNISRGDSLGTLNILSMLYGVKGAIDYKSNLIFKIVDDYDNQLVSEKAAELLGYIDPGTGRAVESFNTILTRAKDAFTAFLKDLSTSDPSLLQQYANGIRNHNRMPLRDASSGSSRAATRGFDPLNPGREEFDPLGGGSRMREVPRSAAGMGARPAVTPRSARGPVGAAPSSGVTALVGLVKTQAQSVLSAGDALQRAIEMNPALKNDAAVMAALKAYENAALELGSTIDTPES
jgi:hypothetical protein